MPALINPGNDQFSVINFLPHQEYAGYSLKVAAKSAAGRRNPCNLTATQHAPGVFFCVVALTHLKFMVWWLTACFYFLRHIIRIMVTVPALSHPEFTFVFLAVRRTDRDARPRPVRVIADCEHAARLKLATEFILSFAARIPVKSAGEVVA